MIEDIIEDIIHAAVKLVVLAGVILGALVLIHCLTEDGYIEPKHKQELTQPTEETLSTKIVTKLENFVDSL